MAKVFLNFLAGLLGLGLILFLAPPLCAQESELVRSIEIRGNKRVDESTILYYIKTKPGEPLNRSQIRKDIEQIYSLGQFKDIQVETQSLPDGLHVIFHVVEIPSVGDVKIIGTERVEVDDIRERIDIKRGTKFQDHMINSSIEEIKGLYHEKGYFFAEVKITTERTPNNLVDVVIRIQEGEKVDVEKIRFVGNKAFTDRELRKQMETQEKTWLSFFDDSGIYQKDILKLDLFRVEAFYQDHGYMKVRVLDPRIEVNKKEKEIYINIPVEEGPQFRVARIAAPGDDTLTSEEILKAIKTRKGEVYNRSQIQEDVLTVSELYSQRGYAYADVNPITNLDDSKKTVDISLEIDKGRKVYVGEISILGNVKTRDNVIRREFRLKEGELFDSSKLKRTKQRINNLGFFEDVKIDTLRGKDPELIDLETTVTERPTGSLTFGVGFSSVENFVFSGSISQNNLFGRGQALVFSTTLSSIRTNFNIAFTEPRLFDSDILGGVDAFKTESSFLSFDQETTGAGLRFGRQLTEYDWVGLNYRFDDVTISGVDPGTETEFLKNENRVTSRVVPSYVRDTRDNFINPSQGWRHVVRSEVAGGILGGSNFVRLGYEVSRYFPLIGKFVGLLHGQVNWADAYGGDDLPAFERYFMGGPSTLRGYTIRDIGPKDSTGDPIGGNQSLLFNAEIQYPFTKSFRGFVFYDRGNVFGSGPDITTTAKIMSLSDMRDSFGGGVRFISPFGPLGLAYGVKLDRAQGETAAEFHFSAGSAF